MKKLTLFLLLCLPFLLGATRYLTDSGGLSNSPLNLELTTNNLGAVPPTKATVGTSPVATGLLFDAVNETYQLQWIIPADWTGNQNITLDLYVALNASETAGDSIAFTADYVSVSSGIDSVSKTSTQVLSTELVLVGCATAGCTYQMLFTLDYTDASNPMVAGDVIILELYRTNVTNVAGVILLSADVHIPRKL